MRSISRCAASSPAGTVDGMRNGGRAPLAGPWPAAGRLARSGGWFGCHSIRAQKNGARLTAYPVEIG